MTWWEAIVLGLVQGLTEFLPISSSAHLRIVGELLPSGADPGAAFTAVTQIGTETAVVIYFRRDIGRIIRAWAGALPVGPWKNTVARTDPDARLGWFVILGSIPIAGLGLLFESAIDETLRNLYITAAMLALFAVLLGWADKTSRRTKTLDQMSWRDAAVYGFAQALALIPGISRSGITIAAGLFRGLKRDAAARFAFLMGIPIIAGAGLWKTRAIVSGGAGDIDLAVLAAGVAAAAISGWLAIGFLLRYLRPHSTGIFIAYRLLAAAVLLALLLLDG